MTIADILFLELGGSIAKAILKLWLKDSSVASDISSDLIDLVKSKTPDVIAQQRAKRLFESIAEKVIEDINPLFDAENSKLPEEGQIAIAKKLSEIFSNTKIDPGVLAQVNLDPSTFKAYLLAMNPGATKDFSSQETQFFKIVLSETCQNIVEIASQLPVFTEQTLSEILKRENELIQLTKKILEDVEKIRKSIEQTNLLDQANQFEREYRRAVARNLDEVELFGTDVSKASRRHRISISYVVLDARKTVPQKEDEAAERNVHRVIKDCPRIILKGDAGSGKTTLLKWIAVQAASGNFPDDLKEFNSYVPFFIRLRNFTDQSLPLPEDFPVQVTPAIVGLKPATWVNEKLKTGKAFVLIDGLDELPQTKREYVRQWLSDLTETFPNARYILSSRPSIINDQQDSFVKFEGMFLQPMTDWAIDMFIDKWHVAVQEIIDEPSEKLELPSLASHLKKVIRENQRIFALAKTPLLCALICALHRDRRQQLPKDRIELYNACTQMLVERREKEIGLDYKGEYPQLGYRQKIAFLKDCAYWFMRNNWSSVEASRLDQHISNKLETMENIDRNISGNNIRRFFVERSGILREPSKGSIDFAHRTFQEFLAAQEVLDEDDIGLLIDRALDNQWSEVIVLAAGLASQKICDQLLVDLIERGNAEMVQARRYQYYLLVASCLETIVSISPKVKKIIDESLSQLTPPTDASEARKWASAGDIAVPYLLEHVLRGDVDSAECIRALTMISSKPAMQALAESAKLNHESVLKVIVEGWSYFDREEFARDVLSKNEQFKKYIEDVPDTRGLRYLPYLERLKIKNGLLISVNDIEGPNLEYISLTRCHKLSRIESLSQITNIKALVLAGCLVLKNIEPLGRLKKLQLLDLSLCEQIDDISPLAEMNNLKVLSLAGCHNVKIFSPLLSLKKLEALNVIGCPQLSFDYGEYVRRTLPNLAIYTISNREVKSPTDSVRPHYRPVYSYSPSTPPEQDTPIPMSQHINKFASACQAHFEHRKSDDMLQIMNEYGQDLGAAFELYKPGYSEDYQTAKRGFTWSDSQTTIPYPAV